MIVASEKPQLTIIVPVFNECELLPRSLRRLSLVDCISKQVIVVDDGSNDGTGELRKKMLDAGLAHEWFSHECNLGKGAAVRTGLSMANGAVIGIHDADLEYYPEHLPELARPVLRGQYDMVLGSRLLGAIHFGNRPNLKTTDMLWSLGAQMVSIAASIAAGRLLTDVETCQKVFSKEMISRTTIEENGFGVETELVMKFAAMGARIKEVPVKYTARGRNEGKKIRLRHGFEALWCIAKYR